jgi:hypothetical protein
VWSWHPDAGVKFARRKSCRRWWLKSPVHQGDHGVTATPSCRECRYDSGEPVVTTLACFVLSFAREAAGASRIRHSLRPHYRRRKELLQTSGAWRRENAKSRLKFRPSSPAKAGDPVRRGLSAQSPPPLDTGSPGRVYGPGTWVTPFGDVGNGFIGYQFSNRWMRFDLLRRKLRTCRRWQAA